MVYTQGAPNIFESYLNPEVKSSSKRAKGSFMQGTLSSSKKQQKEAVVRSMASAIQGPACFSPLRSPIRQDKLKYTVPVVKSKVNEFIKNSFSNTKKSKKSAKG